MEKETSCALTTVLLVLLSALALICNDHTAYAHFSGSGAQVLHGLGKMRTILCCKRRKAIKSNSKERSIRSSVENEKDASNKRSIRSFVDKTTKTINEESMRSFVFMVSEFSDNDWSKNDEDDVFAIRHNRRQQVPYQGNPNPMFSQITTKVPPLFDGRQSWFAYEEAIDDWTDVTELELAKQGAALRNRLEGEAAVYRKIFDRDRLKQDDGVAYFKRTLRRYFIKGAQNVFLYRFIYFVRFARSGHDMLKWLTRFQIHTKRLVDAWNDLYVSVNDPTDIRYLAWFQALGQQAQQGFADQQEALDGYNQQALAAHTATFPLSDNLVALPVGVLS